MFREVLYNKSIYEFLEKLVAKGEKQHFKVLSRRCASLTQGAESREDVVLFHEELNMYKLSIDHIELDAVLSPSGYVVSFMIKDEG